MPSIPSPLDAHPALLDPQGVVPFLERTPIDAAHVVLSLLRFKCIGAMILFGINAVSAVFFAIRYRADGGLAMAGVSAAVLAPFSLGAWLAYRLFGWMQRRRAPPPARLLELSRFGLRVSDQLCPTAPDGPFVDPHGRALLPWTPWRDVARCEARGASLAFALHTPSGGFDLSMTPSGARDAAALAAALWAEAHHPIR
ncbi:MAG: hypothetical protein Q8S73_25060 [Deltaproteobacteria bacterium]|jgi:hypothetical protein|nr:hypothetical protein [Myxococcales bacterium]MDP3217405.1 hypothetical protein [Deltaproteobacteria bacterium]